MREDDRDRVSRLGTEAWKRLKKCKDYNDWLKVGEAILVGREWAMSQAQVNRPEGKGYNMVFGEWLQRYKIDDMDKGDRCRLLQMMEALPMIEEWRRTLTMTARLKLNHPNAIMRAFKRAFEVPDPAKPVKPGLRESVAELSEENAKLKAEVVQLKEHVAEMESAAGSGAAEPTLNEARDAYLRGVAGLPDQEALDVECHLMGDLLLNVAAQVLGVDTGVIEEYVLGHDISEAPQRSPKKKRK